jgi:hypothetical protein
MNAYGIALFVHLCALLAAFAATGLTGLAMRRLRSARVAGEALQWLALGKSAAHVFPVALLTLVASGAYMVHRAWSWDTGWVDAGLAGVVFLGVVGDRLEGGRAGRLAQALAADPRAPIEGAAARLLRDPVWWSASLVNPAVALGVVFVMATKPSLGGSIAALAVAAAAGATAAVPLWRAPERAASSETVSANP